MANLLDQLADVLPPNVIDILQVQLKTIIERGRGTLGATLAVSLSLSLWSANRATKAVVDALNIIYGERERRRFIRLNLASLTLTAGAVVFAALAVGGTVVLSLALSFTTSEALLETLLRLGRWPLLLAISTLALALLYYHAPDREHPRWRWVTAGSGAASILWLFSSMLFSWYATNFAHYDRLYGSLAGIVVLMMWLWLSAVVILLGAEIDAEMEEHAGERSSNEPERTGLPRRA